MSEQKRWRLICYDVRDPKRYRKVFKIVRGVARPVQYSVFRSRLDDRGVERLRWELERVMDPVDSLLVVDLCPRCAAKVVTRNQPDGWTSAEPSFRVIDGATDHGSMTGEPDREPIDEEPEAQDEDTLE